MSVSVEGGRAGDEAQRGHVRHVRGERAEGRRVLGRVRAPASAASAASAAAARHGKVRIGPVTGSTSFPSIAIDGGLEFVGRAVLFFFALVRVQILHIPVLGWIEEEIKVTTSGMKTLR